MLLRLSRPESLLNRFRTRLFKQERNMKKLTVSVDEESYNYGNDNVITEFRLSKE